MGNEIITMMAFQLVAIILFIVIALILGIFAISIMKERRNREHEENHRNP